MKDLAAEAAQALEAECQRAWESAAAATAAGLKAAEAECKLHKQQQSDSSTEMTSLENLASVLTDNFAGLVKDVRAAIHRHASDDEPDAKKQKLEDDKNDFNENSILLREVSFKSMLCEGLQAPGKVPKAIHAKILNNIYFDLKKVKGDVSDVTEDYTMALCKVLTGESRDKDTQIKLSKKAQPATKAELFETLSYFFSVYVQVYPEKAASLFDYLVNIHQQAQVLSFPVLLSLESEMRAKFLSQPPMGLEF